MARRLDIELTSDRGDGTFSWRAAGAKQPKGTLDASLVPSGVGVGDVVKVEAEADLEGLTVTTVFEPKGARKEVERLELLGSGRDEPLVTQVLAGKGRGRGRGRDDDRGRRRGGGDRDGKSRSREGGGRSREDSGRSRDKRGEGRGSRPPRRERPKAPARPKAPRLRPARTHRQAALKALPELQRPLADEVVRGGVPGVRQAVARMNDKAVAEGMPKIKADPLVALAEKLAPAMKAAEWRDRADAAVAGLDEVDLRDIRSVVVAADSAARDDETRALAEQLRVGLASRVESEHRKWLDEIAANIAEGRSVRALRLSSRPPKAGAPLPVDMAEKLAEAASASLTAEDGSDRWVTVIDAVAFSPVRAQVKPQGTPETPSDELLASMKKLAGRIPEIAKLFGIDAPSPRGRKPRGAKKTTPPPPPSKSEAPEAAPASEAAAEVPEPGPEPQDAAEVVVEASETETVPQPETAPESEVAPEAETAPETDERAETTED